MRRSVFSSGLLDAREVCSCLRCRIKVSGGLVKVEAVVEVNRTGVVESFVGLCK